MTRRSVVMLAAALLTGWLAAAQAQTPGAHSVDVLPALLAEVRGLREAIEQMTSAGPRVQLALGRLQLQEQRLSTANSRLTEVRNQLAASQRRASEIQENVANLEGSLSGQREMPKPDAQHTVQDIRRMLTAELAMMQGQLSAASVDVQRLLVQEAALANEVASEQARWSDLNQRLEEIERALRPLK